MCEFCMIGTDTEKTRNAKLEVTAGFKNRSATSAAWLDDGPREGPANTMVA